MWVLLLAFAFFAHASDVTCNPSTNLKALAFLETRARLALVAARCAASEQATNSLQFKRFLDRFKDQALTAELRAGQYLVEYHQIQKAEPTSVGAQHYQSLVLEQELLYEKQGIHSYCAENNIAYNRITQIPSQAFDQELSRLACQLKQQHQAKAGERSRQIASLPAVIESKAPEIQSGISCGKPAKEQTLADWLAFVEVFAKTCRDYFSHEYSTEELAQSFHQEFLARASSSPSENQIEILRKKHRREIQQESPFKYCFSRESEFLKLTKTDLVGVRGHLAALGCEKSEREPAYSSR